MRTTIYGCIEEYGLQIGEMQKEIYAHNERIIESLPETDRWPPLTKNMFAITHNLDLKPSSEYAYSGRIIHFGANFKSFEYGWKEWKLKFEGLLTKLLWLSSKVHFKPEYAGIQTFTWHVDLFKWSLYE